MSDVVEVNGFDNACRLCLTTEQTRSSIFGVPHISVPFAEKIRSCVAIQISSNDKLSTLVCSSCIDSINHWHSYKETCLQSQEKLQQWLAKQNTALKTVTIKEEAVDVEHQDDNAQTVTNDSSAATAVPNTNAEDNRENEVTPATNQVAQTLPEQPPRPEKDYPLLNDIKAEPMDTEDEDDCNVDIESVTSGELLINPMAVVAANAANNERIMEADSTQKFSSKRFMTKKRMRRGPHTHYRGIKIFKKKCTHCKINLHSKHSYMQHMSRYHGIGTNLVTNDFAAKAPVTRPKSKLSQQVNNTDNVDNEPIVDTENENNPEDAEFEKMITTNPLTPVQRNIIGQLKTFSCFACKKTFFDRRHTLNHIRQHMPDLRPYTCIACLTEFSDRSMYKLHCSASFECAMKIALVVPKVGSEKYFTCNMCLRSLSDRQELLNHLASHAEKQQKSLTQSTRAPPKLKPLPTSAPASRTELSSPSKRSISTRLGPYMNGDPAHNHMCDLCGMIYRYRPNMFKHRDLCLTLPENIRTSYRCVHCSMTYLVYKKFYTHVLQDHKKREITCYTCHTRFPTPDDYLAHHETHRADGVTGQDNVNAATTNQQQQPETDEDYSMVVDPMNSSTHPTDVSEKSFNCALCGESFVSKLELTEHRNLHLKVKIYSCVICRSMFSSSGALEVHMKDHGIDDSNEQAANTSCIEYGRDNRSQSSLNDSSLSARSDPDGQFNQCYVCGKNFSNLANLKRHEKNLHTLKQRRRWSCDHCKRRFKSVESHDEHLRLEHGDQQQEPQPPTQPQLSATTGKPLMQCPKCPKTFTYQGNLILHCQNAHKENHFERARASVTMRSPVAAATPRRAYSRGYSCDICSKTFREEQSLKTHRGWHLRSNYRLKVDQSATKEETVMSGPGYTVTIPQNTPKPAKARKSFPNNPSQKQMEVVASLQCQVCDDRFGDVAELRKHLWDVHCARNKPEKTFASELQCELCTNKFADEEALEEHMKWHSQNPILSNNRAAEENVDEIADADAVLEEPMASVSTPSVVKKPFYCDICGKYYSNRKLFFRHKKLHKGLPASSMVNFQSLQTKRPYCQPCQKPFSTDASLKRHKASSCHMAIVRSQIHSTAKKITTMAMVHHPPSGPMKSSIIKNEPDAEYAVNQATPQVYRKKPVTCHICKSMFPNMSILYQHKQLVHKVGSVNNKANGKQQKICTPIMSPNGMVGCNICGKQFPGISNMKQHFAHKHKPKVNPFPCYSPGCKLAFTTAHSLKNHEMTHATILYVCHLCDKHMFSRSAMNKHMIAMHKAIYHSGANKNNLWSEIDLTTYSIKNCQSTECPKCKVKYPNLRALKVHYIKFHEKMG